MKRTTTNILLALAATASYSTASTMLTTAATFGSGGGTGNWDWQAFTLNDTGFTTSGDALPSPTVSLDGIDLEKGTTSFDSTTVGQQFLGVFTATPTGFASLIGVSTNSIDVKSLGSDALIAYTFSGLNLDTSTEYFMRGIVDTVDDGTIGGAGDTLAVTRLRTVAPSVIAGAIHNGSDNDYDMRITVSAVPEPSSAARLGLGGLALILRRRK